MANVIKIKRSTVPGKIPLSTDLEIGELALNTADGVLYTKHSDDTIKQIGGAAGNYSFGATPPESPDLGDLWYDPSENVLYIYIDDGASTYWLDISSATAGPTGETGYTGSRGQDGESTFTWGDNSPENPEVGDTWFDTQDGVLLLYVDDGDTLQWVEVSGRQGETGFTGSQGALGYTGSVGPAGAGYTGSQGETGFVGSSGADGYTGSIGFTGSQGDAGIQGETGYTGSKGDTGLGFRIAKSYASVAALEADTTPTGILAGEFAIVETGDVEDAENSRLYIWTGTQYVYVTDLSGAAGITGPQGSAGFTGSQGSIGFTGSAGDSADVDLSAVDQNIIPAANVTYDLGTDTLRWRDLYLSGNTINLGATRITSDNVGRLEVITPDGTIQLGGDRISAQSYFYANGFPVLTAAAISVVQRSGVLPCRLASGGTILVSARDRDIMVNVNV